MWALQSAAASLPSKYTLLKAHAPNTNTFCTLVLRRETNRGTRKQRDNSTNTGGGRFAKKQRRRNPMVLRFSSLVLPAVLYRNECKRCRTLMARLQHRNRPAKTRRYSSARMARPTGSTPPCRVFRSRNARRDLYTGRQSKQRSGYSLVEKNRCVIV